MSWVVWCEVDGPLEIYETRAEAEADAALMNSHELGCDHRVEEVYIKGRVYPYAPKLERFLPPVDQW